MTIRQERRIATIRIIRRKGPIVTKVLTAPATPTTFGIAAQQRSTHSIKAAKFTNRPGFSFCGLGAATL
jgi:hypothetical protein